MTSSRNTRDFTLSLVRAIERQRSAATNCAAPISAQRLAKVDWHAFVAFSSAHFILPAMAEPLAAAAAAGGAVPADLFTFVAGIRAANRQRNAKLTDALIDLTVRLNAIGMIPVALKGAAFFADPPGTSADWRFMSDIDLLVSPDRLADCVAILRSLGYRPAAADYDPSTEAHFPPLVSPCRAFSVELHTRLFGSSDFSIDVDEFRATACAVQLGAARLSIPSPAYRVAHVLAHAQLHNRNYVARRVVLKDVLDLTMLPREAVLAFERSDHPSSFADPAHRAAALALLATWRSCLGIEGDALANAPAAGRWAQASIARLGWSRWRRIANLPCEMAITEAHRLMHEPSHLGHRARQLFTPQNLLSAGQTWVFKQRQRLWS